MCDRLVLPAWIPVLPEAQSFSVYQWLSVVFYTDVDVLHHHFTIWSVLDDPEGETASCCTVNTACVFGHSRAHCWAL